MKKILFISIIASILMLAGIARADVYGHEADEVEYQHDHEAGHDDYKAGREGHKEEYGHEGRIVAGWALGYLGRTIAISFFLIGMVMGFTRQALTPMAVGLGCSLSIYYFPHVINALNALHR